MTEKNSALDALGSTIGNPDVLDDPPKRAIDSPPHPLVWGRVFLPHHLTDKSPPFHRELTDLVWSSDPRVAIAAPRGFSKSTISSLLCPLYGAAEGLFRYCLLISDTKDQASMFLAEIKKESETNQALLEIYPGMSPGKPWATDDLCFASGIRIQALGSGQKVRGRKHQGARPDLILLDDCENDEQVASLERRLKYRKWLSAAVQYALDPRGRIRIVGTILHTDSLLSRTLRNERWTRRLWSALSDGNRSLWPERFPVETLLAEKEEARQDGLLSVWYQERQNRAIAEEESAFRSSDFHPYDILPPDDDKTVQQWTRSLYVDPAISESQRSDFTAYTIVYSSYDGYWFVEDAFRSRDDPSKIVETIRKLHRRHKFDAIGIESNAYQKSVAFWLKHRAEEDEGISDMPIEAITADTDKRRRIMALQPFYRAGRIKHKRGACQRLETELLNLDSIDHDDVSDSLAGHLLINRRPEPPAKRKKVFDNARDQRAYRHRREMIRQGRLRRLGIQD